MLASLPSILSALCLNTRGLEIFVKAEPFDHLFGVLISPEYLPAMRKKKGADQIGDTATNLGEAMDELMRHQPSLRISVLAALVKVSSYCIVRQQKHSSIENDTYPLCVSVICDDNIQFQWIIVSIIIVYIKP